MADRPSGRGVSCRVVPLRYTARRSGDGLVELDLPAGQHRVDLRFTGARPDPLGVVLTLAGLLALALLRRGGRGR
jgi:hypothetical protein